jgi:hypothetical protein
MMDLNLIGLHMACMRILAPNDQVSRHQRGEQKENKALRRYATEE